MGRTQPEAFAVATAKALPAALTWKLRDPARPDPGRTRKATHAKGPGVASRTKQAGLGRDARARCAGAPPGRLPDPSRARGPPRPENRGPCCVRGTPFIRSTLPVPGLGESCTPAAVTHPGNGTPDSGTAAQTEKVSAAATQKPPNSRLCACVAAIAEPPSLPSFKPPANGAAESREPASSRLLRGPPGLPRRKARSRRTRRPSVGPVISHIAGGLWA